MDDNLFDWHFVLRGPEDTPFSGGVYHGRIILPAQYPYKPPEFMFLCPTGRFEVGKKICLSISQHHPELWQPGWDIRTGKRVRSSCWLVMRHSLMTSLECFNSG